MIFLGARRIAREDYPALLDAARGLLASGEGLEVDLVMEGWSGISFMLEGRDVTVLPGPVDGMVEFWVTAPSEEFRG